MKCDIPHSPERHQCVILSEAKDLVYTAIRYKTPIYFPHAPQSGVFPARTGAGCMAEGASEGKVNFESKNFPLGVENYNIMC